MVEDWEEWVLRRARCNVDDIFAQLRERVEQDVVNMNSISNAKNNISSFQFIEEDKERFVVERDIADPHSNKEGVVFKSNLDTITVEHWLGRNVPQKFSVGCKWNEQECRCELVIDDEPHEVWQVSQKALLPIFFPAPK